MTALIRKNIMNIYSENLVILDTETTGLKKTEICEICILDHEGNKLIDTLVKPINVIPEEVIKIHGITNEMVNDAPSFEAVYGKILECIKDKKVAIYNARFDKNVLISASKWSAVDPLPFEQMDCVCVMNEYASFYGEPFKKKAGASQPNFFKKQKLINACQQQEIKLDIVAHRAYADCLMTLELIKNTRFKYFG